MKQFLLLIIMTLASAVASLWEPFWGVLLYYTLAVLRPQHMWEWALPVQWRWSLYAALIVLVGAAVNLHRVVIKGRFTTVSALLVVYGILLMFSMITAHDPVVAQKWGIEYAKVMLIAMIASVIIEHLWQIRALSVMIVLVISYIAWEINYLYFFENRRLDVFHNGYGGLDNNGAGLMLAMGLPFAYAYATSAVHKWQRLLCCGFGLVIIHAVMMTYSRGAMLAGVVGIVWLLIYHRARMQAVVFAAVLFMAIMFMAGPEIRERFMSTANFKEDPSAQARMDSWAAAWRIAWINPLTGQGIRNSGRYTHNYGADRHGRTIHSLYLQIAADSGFPALMVYLAMLGAAFISLRHTRKICSRYLGKQHSGLDPPRHTAQIQQVMQIAMATEASLVIFSFGGVFLSIEIFELPWLLVIMAGLLPRTLTRHINELEDAPAVIEPRDPMPDLLPRPGLHLAGAD